MPLISKVGQRSTGVRLMFLAMYALLAAGAATMIYPFGLMLAMSTVGRGECQEFRLVPRYLVSEAALFKRYLLDSIPTGWGGGAIQDYPINIIAGWFGRDYWFTSADVAETDLAPVMDLPPAQRRARAGDMRAFLLEACPGEFKMPAFMFDSDGPFALMPDFYAWLRAKYGSLEAVNRAYNDNAAIWEEVGAPVEQPNRRPEQRARNLDWRAFLEQRPPARLGLFDANYHVFRLANRLDLPPDFSGPRAPDGAVIRSLITYDDLMAGRLDPDAIAMFFRKFAPPLYMRIDPALAAGAWQAFLRERGRDPGLPLNERLPDDLMLAGLWATFAQRDCPVAALSLVRPEDHWRAFLRARYADVAALNRAHGAAYRSFDEAVLPHAVFRHDCFLRERPGLRRAYLLNNYRKVLEFAVLHGAAMRVTLIYIVLMIAATLTVNPLAAYAMSRFRLKESHHILLFLLVTMTFPGEVLMIPNFLMIKSFPLGQLAMAAACLLLFYGMFRKLARRLPLPLALLAAAVVPAILAGWVLPRLAARYDLNLSVSLMNSFWALILPSLANGYGIFLLKGFFDSLPPELYEAGLIDGAGEFRMFWQITLPLSKPILAVMALGAFSSAYGAFMHAFLTCQDPKMWTFMVFLYEFQQTHSLPLVMASLVVAAIPTLLVFIFCQNIILRGIVIPTFK